MKSALIVFFAIGLSASSLASAQSLMEDDINLAQEAGFKIFDKDGDGTATPSEIVVGSKEIFEALDQNKDGIVAMEEFQVFSMGFEPLAERLSRQAEYREARNLIFVRWDMDASQGLAVSEVAAAVMTEAFVAIDGSLNRAGYGKSQFVAEMSAVIE